MSIPKVSFTAEDLVIINWALTAYRDHAENHAMAAIAEGEPIESLHQLSNAAAAQRLIDMAVERLRK